MPAVGVVNGLSTSKQLRPGMIGDVLTVPIYQCEDDPGVGRTAALYEYVEDVVITGEEIESLIPENSPVDLTIKVDNSGQLTMEIYFPSVDFTISKSIDTNKKQSVAEAEKLIPKMVQDAQRDLNRLAESGINTGNLQSELNSVMDENKNSQEKKAVLQHLKEVLRKIEDEDAGTEWERLEKEIREEFERLEKADRELGNDKSHQLVGQLRNQADQVIRSKNVLMGRDVLDQITTVFFQLTMIYQCMGLIRDCSNNFGRFRWKDANRAHQLVNQGMAAMANQPTVEQLQPIAAQLVGLMPREDAENAGGFLH
jgi:molecular chaperone DnaK